MSKPKSNDRLRAERKRWRLSQAELAGFTRLKARSFVSQIELSVRKPPLEFALACETVFGKPIRKIFPKLSKSIEARVLQYATTLHDALTNERNSSAEEKRQLVRRILSGNRVDNPRV